MGSLVPIIVQKAGPRVDSLSLTFSFALFGFIQAAAFLFLNSTSWPPFSGHEYGYTLIVLTGLLSTAGQICYTIGMQNEVPVVCQLVLQLDVAWAVLWQAV